MGTTKLVATKGSNGKTKLVAQKATQPVLPGIETAQDQPKDARAPKPKGKGTVLTLPVKPKGKAATAPKGKATAVAPKPKPAGKAATAAPKGKATAVATKVATAVKDAGKALGNAASKAATVIAPSAPIVAPNVDTDGDDDDDDADVSTARRSRRSSGAATLATPKPGKARRGILPKIPRALRGGMVLRAYHASTLSKINRVMVRGQQNPRYAVLVRGVNGADLLVAYASKESHALFLRRKARGFARRILNQRYRFAVKRLSKAQRAAVK